MVASKIAHFLPTWFGTIGWLASTLNFEPTELDEFLRVALFAFG
jgi:hypothetical protein